MSCRTVCGRIKLMSGCDREAMVVAAVSGVGRQAYLLAQQRLLTERLATLSVTRQAIAVQEIQVELARLADQLRLVS
ncbi:hypothetical protein ACFQH1_06790 [Lactiplantibacillus daoliensis]|uniref:Uncharacterized protein n=1 Tax=Lactiplantibacillus daoliensis TaxID=2559916 RepID=A0ABW1UGC0_9LACO|nr:hypothetical protein [Lactiplantibacillus daoliensis]